MTGKKGIEYSDKSWNAFSGCLGIENGNCAVGKKCWAYGMSLRLRGRFGYDAANPFKPTFHRDKLEEPLKRRKPTRYVVSFMGDIAYAQKECLEQIIAVIKQCPQHRFIFLTKVPNKLADLNCEFPDNCIVGVTVNRQEDVWRIGTLCKQVKARWFWASFEPLYAKIICDPFALSWIVVGAQTNPEFQPETEWVREVMRTASMERIPIFMKPNLKGANHIQELPEVLRIGD